MNNVIPFKQKKSTTKIELPVTLQYTVLEDGSLWFRHKILDKEEFSEWEVVDISEDGEGHEC